MSMRNRMPCLATIYMDNNDLISLIAENAKEEKKKYITINLYDVNE